MIAEFKKGLRPTGYKGPAIPRYRKRRKVYANDNDAMVPELWAKYTLAILESNMIAGNIVYRDFEPLLANFGDTVNTRKPGAFTVSRKTDADSITTQDATTTNVPVVLNMHPYVSFIIKDGEESLSMESLVDLYLEPGVKAMAEHIDQCILGQYPQFLSTAGTGGQLGGLTSSNYPQYLAETGLALDITKCPADGRKIIVTPAVKNLLLQNTHLVDAQARGDDGTALRTASMGEIYGFDHYMCQNMRTIGTVDVTSSTFQLNGAHLQGATTLTVNTGTGALAIGQWLKLNGKPYQIQTHTETIGNTTSMTILPALRENLATATVLTVYDPGAINFGAGYAVGYSKAITYNGTTIRPKVGQFLSFGTTGNFQTVYTIVAVDATTLTLDRPLADAWVDTTVINFGPPGDYNLALRREAIALVIRPLKLPRAGAGAISATLNHNGFSLRVVIAYDYTKQGHAVTIDCLMGVKVLDTSYGAVLLA